MFPDLWAGPESVKPIEGHGKERQAVLQALFTDCSGLAQSLPLGIGSYQRMDCAHSMESPEFSWPGLGGSGTSGRLTDGPVPGALVSAKG